MKRQINKVIALALAALTVTLAQPAYATIIADGYGQAVSGGSKVISDENKYGISSMDVSLVGSELHI